MESQSFSWKVERKEKMPVEVHGDVVGELTAHAEDDTLRALQLVDVHHHLKRDLIKVEPEMKELMKVDGQ